MNVIITGKNLQVRDDLKAVIEQKLKKYDKYFHSEIEAHATLSHIKNQQVVELTSPLKNGVTLRAEEASDSMTKSIEAVVDKISRQIRKHKTALEKRYRDTASIRFDDIPTDDIPEEEAKIEIVKSKRFAIKPMDPEEAVLQMQMLHHDFFVFLNAETNEVNVVYERKKGKFGLIEPYL